MLIEKQPQGKDVGEIAQITASVVVYRTSEAELRELLKCFHATKRQILVMVIDNSPDETLRVVVESSGVAEYRWLRKNLGYGSGHNVAIRELVHRGQYHMVVNPDIRFGPDVVDELAHFMDLHPEVGDVMPRIAFPDGTEQRLCKQLPTPFDLLLRRFFGTKLFQNHRDRYELRDLDMSLTRQIPCLSGCFMFLRSSLLQEIGGFDERYFMYMEDVDLCRRIGQFAETVFFPDATVVHGYAKGSYRDPKLLIYHIRSSFKYFCKWGWFFDRERLRRNLSARTEIPLGEVPRTSQE